MNKPNVAKFFKGVQMAVSRRSPEILTGIGIAGMVTTTVLAVKATPKALQLIEEEKRSRIKNATVEEARDWSEAGGIKITPVEYVKICWKPYIPAMVTGVFSVACLVGASSVNARRNAAIATAYKLSETALSEYKEKVVETIGEKKEKAIQEKVAQSKIDSNPVSKNEVIITDKGETLFYDAVSGRYFKSDIETVRQAINELNRRMMYENYISLTEFYDAIGLEQTKLSDELGWNLDNGLIEADFSSRISDDGRPCIVLDYLVAPRYDFSKLI